MPGQILYKRRSPHPRLNRYVFAILRFIVYGMVGISSEVANYTFTKVGRMFTATEWIFQSKWSVDPQLKLSAIWDADWTALYGQCSLWMFPIYGFAALFAIEPIYRYCRKEGYNFIVRGTLYAIAILVVELIWGYILLWTVPGYYIWRYTDSLNIMEMTTLYLFPLWFLTGLFVEFMYNELIHSSLRQKAASIADRLDGQ